MAGRLASRYQLEYNSTFSFAPPARWRAMLQDLKSYPADGKSFDVVVVGAGAAGMAAALFATLEGARVLLVEHTSQVGGTSALSAGTLWIPGTRHASSVGATDTIETAAAFLGRAIGTRIPEALRQALLANGPDAVDRLEARTEVKLRAYPLHPDYLSELEGSALKGRALEPLPFDGRRLGDLFALIRPPIPEFTVLGGMMVDRNDIFHLLRITRSWASFRHGAGLIARHLLDRLTHPRGTRLVMGNALIGRLLLSLSQQPLAALAMETAVLRLERDAAGITGLVLRQRGVERRVGVTGGVILASGGFNRDMRVRAEFLPGANADWCPGAPGHTGEAQALAKAVGAHFAGGAMSHAFWAPVSIRQRADGTRAVFPHFVMDRGKPGIISVNQAGRRFVNESTSYHLFALAMQASHKTVPTIPTFMIADADAIRRYGLGMVRPGAKGLGPFLADGYLTEAPTLEALAAKLGIDAAGLADSVARNNAYAKTGVDKDFARGSTAYQRHNGDANWPGPNPCLGPIARAPFYAIRLYPGDIGAATGLATDTDARVLDAAGQPIAGLYAVGADMHSVMGGVYTAPGITLGPGLVFGSIAARHAAARRDGASTLKQAA
jgi:succinate dehydrogenase/fumarate reductase flavoprotein subunit